MVRVPARAERGGRGVDVVRHEPDRGLRDGDAAVDHKLVALHGVELGRVIAHVAVDERGVVVRLARRLVGRVDEFVGGVGVPTAHEHAHDLRRGRRRTNERAACVQRHKVALAEGARRRGRLVGMRHGTAVPALVVDRHEAHRTIGIGHQFLLDISKKPVAVLFEKFVRI